MCFYAQCLLTFCSSSTSLKISFSSVSNYDSVSDEGGAHDGLSSIQSPSRISLVSGHLRSALLQPGSIPDDVGSAREATPTEQEEEGEINSSAALLSTSVERMARLGAQSGEAGEEPLGLTPSQCQAVYEQARLVNATLLSVAQTAGYLAAQSVVATRTIWLDFVKFRGRGAPNAADLRTIAAADVDDTGLFGAGLEAILSNRETFLDRRAAMEDILERKDQSREPRPSTSGTRGGERNRERERARSPQARSRSGPAAKSRGGGARRGDREKGRGFRPSQPFTSYGPQSQQGFQRRDDFRGGHGRGGRGQGGPSRQRAYDFSQGAPAVKK